MRRGSKAATLNSSLNITQGLIVATIGLALSIQDALPVLLLELSLGVDVNKHLDEATLLARLPNPHRC
jgi:hypothetical protein